MTDAITPEAARQAELHDLEKLMKSKTRREICPYCDNRKWYLLNNKDIQPVLMLAEFKHFPVYALACTNCGYVRHHLMMIVTGELVGDTEFVSPRGAM